MVHRRSSAKAAAGVAPSVPHSRKRSAPEQDDSAHIASKQSTSPAKRARHAGGDKKHEVNHTTLFVRNLAYDTTSKDLEDLFSGIGPVKWSFIVTDPATKASRGFGYVHFVLPDDGDRAMKELQGQDLKGRPMRIRFAQPRTTAPARVPDATAEKLAARSNRLIIRNIDFRTTEADIRKAVEPHGTVQAISIPTKEDGKRRGFAFLTMANHKQAAKAMAAINAAPLRGRQVAADFAIPKNTYVEVAAKEEEVAEEKDEDKEDSENADAEDDEANEGEEEEKEDSEEGIDDEDDQEYDEADEAQDEADESEEDNDEDNYQDVDSDDDETDNEDEDDTDDKAPPTPRIPRPTDVDEGKTVFVRGVSFETTDERLREALETFGTLTYCVIVKDKETGRSKGTAFAKFAEKEAADACLAESARTREAQNKLQARRPSTKFVSVVPRLIDDDTVLLLDGRLLDIVPAVTRDQSREIAAEATAKKDKRNLYLAREGFLAPTSEAYKALPVAEQRKRDAAAAEKKAKLRNPNYFISKTRLSIRNMPLDVDEARLKSVCLDAVKSRSAVADGSERAMEGFSNPTKIHQVKVVRSADRTTADGKGRSTGFGFVEFTEHAHALLALRHLNNNPKAFGPGGRRPIVEFAIEDVQAIRKRAMMLHRLRTEGPKKVTPREQTKEVAPSAPPKRRADGSYVGGKPKKGQGSATPKGGKRDNPPMANKRQRRG